MSFLSIAFLTALPLLAAPILLHLFDRRKNVVIEWGAMQFLMEAASHKSHQRRVQQWLLLAMRVAALAALILALAQPLMPGNWFDDGERRETIILLDNSMSTMRIVGDASVFAHVVARAEQMIDEVAPREAIRLMVTSPYPIWIRSEDSGRGAAADRMALRELLHELRPTRGASDLQGALTKAVLVESSDPAVQMRRIALVTDSRAHDWETADRAGWSRFRDSMVDARLPTTLEVIHVDSKFPRAENLAVNRVRSNRAVVGVDQSIQVTAEIQNFSATESTPRTVHWMVDGQPRHESPVPPLAAGATYEAAWQHSFSETGVFTVACRIDADDDLPADDREALVVDVVQRVPVLLVESAEGFAEMQQDAYLVKAALGRIEEEDEPHWQAVFQPRTVAPSELESIELDDFRAVVVPNLTQLSPGAISRLASFVARGGGLWLALGPRTDVAMFNRDLFHQGEGLSPVGIDMLVNEVREASEAVTINPFLKTHPATIGLADDQRLDTGEVKISNRFRFRVPDGLGYLSVLLDLNNGEPLAVENQVGRGRVIVQAIPLRMQWSNLAISQAFVVMVQDWLGYLTEPGATQHNLTPGDPISVLVAATDDPHATLTLPDGSDVPVSGETLPSGILFRTSHTVLPGAYSLDIGTPGQTIAFHIAHSSSESGGEDLTASDRQFLEEVAGFAGAPTAGRMSAASPGAKYRNPLWPALLILLIALMTGELLLSGKIARKRFSTVPIPRTPDPKMGVIDQPPRASVRFPKTTAITGR